MKNNETVRGRLLGMLSLVAMMAASKLLGGCVMPNDLGTYAMDPAYSQGQIVAQPGYYSGSGGMGVGPAAIVGRNVLHLAGSSPGAGLPTGGATVMFAQPSQRMETANMPVSYHVSVNGIELGTQLFNQPIGSVDQSGRAIPLVPPHFGAGENNEPLTAALSHESGIIPFGDNAIVQVVCYVEVAGLGVRRAGHPHSQNLGPVPIPYGMPGSRIQPVILSPRICGL